jgi:PKD repeat protein
MTSDYDIFISSKNLGADAIRTEDSHIAEKLHIFLVNKGFRVFFSNISLAKLGVAAYKEAIDSALDRSKILIIVGTSLENIDAKWVRYEWDSFFNDILSGVKPEGKVFAYIKNVKINELPRAIRNTQCIEHGPDGFEQLYHFISNALGQRLSAQFSADETSGKFPLTVTFKDESLGNAIQYMWDFGDGEKTTVPNPVHTFQKPGVYSIKLTLSNEEETNSTVRENYVSVLPRVIPEARFSVNANSGKAPFEGIFKDASTGNPTRFFWDFGDGCSSDTQNPTHIFEKPGKYPVSLTVTNDDGSDTTTKAGYIQVISPPRVSKPISFPKILLLVIPALIIIGIIIVYGGGAGTDKGNTIGAPSLTSNFSMNKTSGYAPLTVSFMDVSEGSPDTWQWDFGDGSSSTNQNPIYEYKKPGNYSVQLLIANNGSIKVPSILQTISVLAPIVTSVPNVTTSQGPEEVSQPQPEVTSNAQLDFNANKVINSLYTVYFEATNVPAGTYAYHWDFGDNKDSYSKTGVHTYGGYGIFMVTLRIETPSGTEMKVKTLTMSNTGTITLQ